MAHFKAEREVAHPRHHRGNFRLCLQWGKLVLNDGSIELGYRFIWRRPDNSIQSRPANIPSLADVDALVALARHYPAPGRR